MSRRDKNKNEPGVKPEKTSAPGRIGRLFRRVFGKARWFLIGMVIFVIFLTILGELDPCSKKITSLSSEFFSETYGVSGVYKATVNSSGWAELTYDRKSKTVAALVNIDTGEQRYAQMPRVPGGDDFYIPTKLTYSDDGKLYAILTDYGESTTILRNRIVLINDKYEIEKEYCTIDYDESEGVQYLKLSAIEIIDGKLTFSRVERDETRLYMIDPETGALTISDPYPTDPDGTFTFLTIPLSDSYLFLRSDGNVYRTRFGEPLGESIFRFEPEVYNEGGYFNFAAAANGKLYVGRTGRKGKVYCLENGALTEVFDFGSIDGIDDSLLISVSAYRPEGSGAEQLVFVFEDSVYTFDGSKAEKKDVTVTVKNHLMYYVETIGEFVFFFCLAGLIINLFIRKKTLLYKQIAMTLPVLLIPAIAIALTLYADSEEDNTENTSQELDRVCKMGISALDGYDYSGIDSLSSETGAAVWRLHNKLVTFDPDHSKYIFSVVKRTGESRATVLVRTDRNPMPMYFTTNIASEKEIVEETGGSGNYLFRKIESVISDSYSSIYVLGSLGGVNGSEYYLKVEANTWSFWESRKDILFDLIAYMLIIIAALTVITTLSSLYITRTIKKATKAVEKISGGDLSARIDYRSKDELGEICSQVNGMAQSLETLFAEKDKTEQFYYKFVPEKFRELLGKESFTDLELGDASSRELTVLFFDIRAFSINSEIMTAKENFEFVNVIYGKAGPIVRRFGGFVDKYIGDAVMALFENADDAVKCGIELYKAIVLDRSTAEAIHISDLNIGIGIHSGMARIGIVGESERLSGTVISDTVNLSSRLETLTKQYKTAMLISKDTVDRMADPDSLGLRYLGIIQVAGVNEVKAVYEVLDCLPEEERARRSGNTLELREAVRLFHLGRRDEAVDILRKLSDSGRNDYVTDMYLDYISGMSEEDKGNVFRFVRK